MDVFIRILILGLVATIAIDIWATFSNRVLKFPRTNWAMVGRWLCHMPSGTFMHQPISASPEMKNEHILGWLFHYFIGVTYAAIYCFYVYVFLGGTPTLVSAWFFGLLTILSPWLIMQPGLGLGFCAVKAPQPTLVRLQNIIIHSIFGVVLYYAWPATNVFIVIT